MPFLQHPVPHNSNFQQCDAVILKMNSILVRFIAAFHCSTLHCVLSFSVGDPYRQRRHSPLMTFEQLLLCEIGPYPGRSFLRTAREIHLFNTF